MLLLLIAMLSSAAFAQVSYTPLPKEYQKVLFLSSDSAHKFTRIIGENGYFLFTDGFVTSTYFDDSTILWTEVNKKMVGYKAKIMLSSRPCDTITSYFPQNAPIDLWDKLYFSYALREFGEQEIMHANQKTARLVHYYYDKKIPFHGAATQSYIYEVVKAVFYDDSVRLSVAKGQSTSFNGLQPTFKGSWLLKKSVGKYIIKFLNKSTMPMSTSCTESCDPWILEYNDGKEYRCYLLSNCSYRCNRKDLKPVIDLKGLLDVQAWRYSNRKK